MPGQSRAFGVSRSVPFGVMGTVCRRLHSRAATPSASRCAPDVPPEASPALAAARRRTPPLADLGRELLDRGAMTSLSAACSPRIETPDVSRETVGCTARHLRRDQAHPPRPWPTTSRRQNAVLPKYCVHGADVNSFGAGAATQCPLRMLPRPCRHTLTHRVREHATCRTQLDVTHATQSSRLS